MSSVIRTKELNVGYGQRTVVANVQIEALKGSMICLLGPNGSGKSTILRTLSAMLAPVSGTVYLHGQNVLQIQKQNLARRMAVVLTQRANPGLLTAFDVVAMGRHPYTGFFGRLKQEDRRIIHEALTSVHAETLTDRYFNQLSDGEKQKVMIARALAQQPELIVLDEPTSHLDIRHRVEVMGILSKLCREQGITVIMALHDIDLAIKGCQNVLLVKDGKVIAQGSPEQVVKAGTIQSLYDIHDAQYHDLLGSIEFGDKANSQVFVVGGGRTGIPVYRALSRAGIGMDCGVLHESDLDTHVAKALSNTVITEKDFEPISQARYEQALALAKKRGVVIDTGFPVGTINERNAALLRQAAREKMQVFSLRKDSSANFLYREMKENVFSCVDMDELIPKLDKVLDK